MASIHKDPRGKSPFYYAAFQSSDGKRVFRSTKQKDRSSAFSVALEWERAAASARQGVLTEVQARKVIDDILERSGQGPTAKTTIGEFLMEWVCSKELTKAANTSKRYRHTVEAFIKTLKHRKSAPLSALTPREIQRFRDDQIAQGKGATSANMVVKTLRVPLNSARRQGLILTNPAEAVEFLPSDASQREAFSLEQLRLLMTKASLEWRGMILLAATAGLRLGDASRLTWKNVDLERKALRLFPEKSKRGARKVAHEVPILPDLEGFLLDVPVGDNSPATPLFPNLCEVSKGGKTGLSARFRALMLDAGIDPRLVSDPRDEGRNPKSKGRRFFALGFHSLRHSFVTLGQKFGVPEEIRQKTAGHASAAIHQVYTHTELETIREAYQGFPTLLGEIVREEN